MRVEWLMTAALGLAAAGSASAQPASAPRPMPPLAVGQAVTGELSPLDAQRRSGKYEDVYRIDGRRGQRIELSLSSADFDPYLLITGPAGFMLGNDDEEGDEESLASRLIVELPADGVYRVSATSFSPGAMGAYRLEMAAAHPEARPEPPLPATPIVIGVQQQGRLEPRDPRPGGDRYQDRYRLTARRGERVRISLASRDFDTTLTLQAPDGVVLSNDDTVEGEETSTDSRIETVLAEDGDYLVTVSSFAGAATGSYRLAVEAAGNPRHARVAGGARVLAVAVGVSDYERMSDLPNTDDDATGLLSSLRQAGLLHPQSIALTNDQATAANVRAALRRAAAAAGPDDVVMFFYSGHGDQVDVARSGRELDGRAETIELYDEAMTDAQLEPLINALDGRMVLVAIDACYSGGFRNLVNRPNVMGLFSSEEDLTSLVASRLQAGGYLSHYLRTGLSGEADNDGDRVIGAGELATYLRRRFRMEGDIPASTREDESNFQYLLVERGGVHVDDAVVRLSGGPAPSPVRTLSYAPPPVAEEADVKPTAGKLPR